MLCIVGFSYSFSQTPTPIIQESFEGSFPPAGWTIFNNGTGNSWTQNTTSTYASNGSKSMTYAYTASSAADAWAFTPLLNLNTNPVFITFWVSVRSASFPESLKFTVGTGNTVADQQTVLIDSSSLTNTKYRQWSTVYTPTTAGTYYFAFNCYSAADMYNLFVDSVTFSQVLPSCTGAPVGGTTITSDTAFCPGSAFILSVSGSTSGASSITYQWQSSTNNTTWTDIAGATNMAFTDSAGITTPTYFRRKISCSSFNAYSSTVYISVNAASLCVCSPNNGTTLHGGTSPNIDTVSIVGTTLYNISTGTTVPTSGYTLYADTSKMPTLIQNITYTLQTGFSGIAIGSVWFDWNQNGIFDATEWTQITTSGTSGTISFTVPATALIGKTLMRIRTRSTGSSNASGDACTQFFSGETEDYLINIIPGASCTGTPSGGTISASANPVCTNSNFVLSVSGSTANVSGLTYQWQSSPNGTNWSNITGSINQTDTIKGLATATYFRRAITCSTSNQTVYSTSVNIAIKPTMLCVCSPTTNITLHSTTNGPAIDTVIIAGTVLNNISSTTIPTGGYTLYSDTTMMPSLKQAVTYTLQTSYSATAITSVWFDWNQNGLFDSAEWKQVNTTGTKAIISFTVPANASLGKTLMRIRSKSSGTNAALNACTSFTTGETEDYLINVVAGTVCTGTPSGGTILATSTYVCSSSSIVLTDSLATNGVMGLTYQWQSSANGAAWTDIAGGASESYTFSGLSSSTYYRRATTCTTSNQKVYSTGLLINLNPNYICNVCSPNNGTTLHSGTSSAIDSVVITGTSLINSSGSTIPTNGYTLYTDTTKMPTLLLFSTYTLHTTFSATAIGSVWFDWNQSGTFDSTEWTQITTSGSGGTISFTVPANALVGKTLMRIRTRSTGSSNGIGDPCTTFFSGETEDYIINVSALSNSTIQGNIYYPNKKIIPNTKVMVSGSGLDSTIVSGSYTLNEASGGNYTLRVLKNNDVAKSNGVTALDLALIQSHILGKARLNSPYKYIATDVNGDGKITALDLVYIKRLILGIDTVFPVKKLWVFIDSSYVFSDTTNPFPFKDSISINGLSVNMQNLTFIGIKLGDVNWDWNPAIAKPASKTAMKLNGELKLEAEDPIEEKSEQ